MEMYAVYLVFHVRINLKITISSASMKQLNYNIWGKSHVYLSKSFSIRPSERELLEQS